MKGIIYPGMLLCFLCIFGFEASKGLKDQKAPVKVKLVTTHGEIVLKLYDETPLHRDNFIKIIRDTVLDGVLFHRIRIRIIRFSEKLFQGYPLLMLLPRWIQTPQTGPFGMSES